MKKIGIFTATRAEYGLLYPVIKALRKYEGDKLTVELIVTGTHLYQQYGMTINEIKGDGFRIDHIINIPVASEERIDIPNNQAETLKAVANLFDNVSYDAILILGDRYETLMIAIAAVDYNIPIFHMYGGDTTEGAIDECIRHSISKMSYLHFTTNEASRRRVIQLGESPKRVFNFGATGIDNIINLEKLSKEEALDRVKLKDCKYALCTYHPVTLGKESIEMQMLEFKNAINEFSNIEFIITKSNADLGGTKINTFLDEMAVNMENVHVFSSLGVLLYLSLMQYAEFVLGNSSSGIMEAPAFHIPTVNIGDRQKGRLQAGGVINCGISSDEIKKAINIAISDEGKKRAMDADNPYGVGNSGEKIAEECVKWVLNGTIDIKKSFYNIGKDIE